MEFFRCGRQQFLVQNNFGFFEIYGVSAWKGRGGGLSQCGHFADKEKVVNFLRFCAGVFYGRSLTDCLEAPKSREFKHEQQNLCNFTEKYLKITGNDKDYREPFDSWEVNFLKGIVL